jgi:sporulation protein YlmC with PRC-barrel domain
MLVKNSVVALTGATCIAIAAPAFAQSQQDNANFANLSCNQIQSDMRSEVRNLSLDQSIQDRIDNLLRQARQSQSEEDCLRTLRQANAIISRETGDAPISSSRFRQALQDARASGQTGSKHGGARQTGDRRKERAPKSTATMSESDAARMPVTFSNSLIGRSVQDLQGESAGQLEYVVVDTGSGDIRFAVIGSGGFLDLGEELTAVPWDKVQVRTWGANSEPRIWLDVTLDQLKAGRRITEDGLDQLTSPSFQTQILSFYVPVEMDQNRADRSSQNRTRQDREQRSDQTDQNRDRQAKAQTDRQMDRSDSARSSQDQGQSGGKQQNSVSRDGQRDQTLMLVGRELITTLSPSQTRTGQQIKGATVETSDGREVGEIDRLVLDVERGKVAYALVARGGFLGIGEEWRPVPLTALTWKNSDVYALSQGQSQLEKMPKLSSDELPSRIRQGDLKKLYQAYGTLPYWQNDNRSSQSETSRNRDRN